MCLSKSWHIYSFISLWRATIWCQAVPVISRGFDATAPGRSGTFRAVPILYGHVWPPNFTCWTSATLRSFWCILGQSTSARGEIWPKMCFHFPILLKQQLVTDGHNWSHLVTYCHTWKHVSHIWQQVYWHILVTTGTCWSQLSLNSSFLKCIFAKHSDSGLKHGNCWSHYKKVVTPGNIWSHLATSGHTNCQLLGISCNCCLWNIFPTVTVGFLPSSFLFHHLASSLTPSGADFFSLYPTIWEFASKFV